MGRGMGVAIAACAALALVAAPAALAAQGSERWTREDDITYTADPGETNQHTVDGAQPILHLRDFGATSASPLPAP